MHTVAMHTVSMHTVSRRLSSSPRVTCASLRAGGGARESVTAGSAATTGANSGDQRRLDPVEDGEEGAPAGLVEGAVGVSYQGVRQ